MKIRKLQGNNAMLNRAPTNMEENTIECPNYLNIGSNLQVLSFDYLYSIDTSPSNMNTILPKAKSTILNEIVDRYCNENYVMEIKTNDYSTPIDKCESEHGLCEVYSTKIMIVMSDLASLFDINDYEVTYLLSLKTTTQGEKYAYYNSLSKDVDPASIEFVSCDRVDTRHYELADYYSTTTKDTSLDGDLVDISTNITPVEDKKDQWNTTQNIDFKYKVTPTNEPDVSTHPIDDIEIVILEHLCKEVCSNDHVLQLQLNSTELDDPCDNNNNCTVYRGDLAVTMPSIVTTNDKNEVNNTAMNTLHKYSDSGDFNVLGYIVEILQDKKTRREPYTAQGIEKEVEQPILTTSSSSTAKQTMVISISLLLVVVLLLLLFTFQIRKRNRTLRELDQFEDEEMHNKYNINYNRSSNIPAAIMLDQNNTLPSQQQPGYFSNSYGNASEDSSIIKPRYSDLGGVYKSQDVHRCMSASCNVCKHAQFEKGVEFFNVS